MNNALVERFESFIEKHGLFQKEDKLLLAISGGGDSVCLFHILRIMDYKFHCAHVNYKLRGDESEGDQVFLEELCNQHNIELHILESDLSHLKKEKGNLQEVARQKRYDFFSGLTLEHKFDKILTAHTRTDDIETTIQMLARSSGIKGISGIPMKRDKISRPLLFATTIEIGAWMTKNGFQFRSDSSNESRDYTRNRIRKEVLPALEDIYPTFQSQAGESLLLLKEYNRFIQQQIKSIKASLVFAKDGYLSIDETKLRETGFEELILFELLNPYGFNNDQCIDILATSQKGSRFLSNEHELITDNNAYSFRKRKSDIEKVLMKIIEPGDYSFSMGILKVFEKVSSISKFQKDNLTAYLNPEKVKFPMLLRSWSDGDRISPFGMNGKSKKVKDILKDKKYNLFEKEKILVLEIDGEICWIPGICISHNFRIQRNSKIATCIEFIPYHQTMEQH